MLLSDDVSISDIAAKCEHYTGADLKALLYNAQLEAIHDIASPVTQTGVEGHTALHIKDGRCRLANENELLSEVCRSKFWL